MNTKKWLLSMLTPVNHHTYIVRNGRTWKAISGFSSYGWIFCIYKDDNNYCVHSSEEWHENEEPNMGYYNKDLNWDDLIGEIAIQYDNIRNNK